LIPFATIATFALKVLKNKYLLKTGKFVGYSVGSKCFTKQKSSQQNAESLDTLNGDPTEDRTPVSGVRVDYLYVSY
jgi:hypothetical protein